MPKTRNSAPVHPIIGYMAEQPKLSALTTILANLVSKNLTDLHIHSDARVFVREMGQLKLARNFNGLTNKEGFLSDGNGYLQIEQALVPKFAKDFDSIVERGKTVQARIQRIPSANTAKLIVRVQPATPPQIDAVFKGSKFVRALEQCSGLIVFAGGIGAGKTTTAASLCAYLSERKGKHVMTLEDPVEYTLPQASHLDVIMPGAYRRLGMQPSTLNRWRSVFGEGQNSELVESNETSKGIDLYEGIRIAKRANIDALFVGEIRDAETRDECVDFAAAKEVIVTTIHAGSVSDAVLRLMKPSNRMDMPALKTSLSQVLAYVVYVALAYTSRGEPVPVYIGFNAQEPSIRSVLAGSDPAAIKSAITNQVTGLVSTSANDNAIPVREGVKMALAKGATKESVMAALPSEYLTEAIKDLIAGHHYEPAA